MYWFIKDVYTTHLLGFVPCILTQGNSDVPMNFTQIASQVNLELSMNYCQTSTCTPWGWAFRVTSLAGWKKWSTLLQACHRSGYSPYDQYWPRSCRKKRHVNEALHCARLRRFGTHRATPVRVQLRHSRRWEGWVFPGILPPITEVENGHITISNANLPSYYRVMPTKRAKGGISKKCWALWLIM